MKIVFASYQPLSILHGGPRVQTLQTKLELEKLGVRVELFDSWKHFVKEEKTFFHIFAANIGTYHLTSILHDFKLPFVASSIFYTRQSPFTIRLTLRLNKMLKTFKTGIWTNYEFTRQVCDWSKAVLPNTTDEKKLVTQGLQIEPQKVTIVPNGVEARFKYGDPSLFKKKYGIDKFILNVGHIGPARKNVLQLIRAMQQIDHPSVIIGKVTDSPAAKECLAEAAKSKQITVIEGLDNDSDMLASAYAAADVFALPSLFETPGIAALEAGLAGAKIVITPIGGTKDYFGTMAEYVDPYSVDSIRNGITFALNSQKNSHLQQHIEKEFLWSRVAEKTLAVYKQVFQ
jgi:glycosyltransferase involved in cell wall biosynthesis